MKKFQITIVTIIAVIVGFFLFIQNVNVNRLGADNYYVQITENGKKIEYKSTNGEKFVSYEYTLPAINEDGKEQNLTFTSNHQLREKAYINLFVKREKEVTSYQEVKKEEIPAKAREKLK